MTRFYWHTCYAHPLPEGHRFPMQKYNDVHEEIIRRGLCNEAHFYMPEMAKTNQLKRVHHPEYVESTLQLNWPDNMLRRLGFGPLTEELIERERLLCGGTIQAAEYAIAHGAAINLAGGTHHAFSDKGEGYCIFNDVAVAAQEMVSVQGMYQVLIVDLDVHQGNGTAEIFEGNTAVYTFSMHSRKGYPLKKQSSDRDVELAAGTTGESYLERLKQELLLLSDNTRAEMVFYVAGVDVIAGDKLGDLQLTADDCRQRDELVYEWCFNKGLPVVTTLGGGYHEDLATITTTHCNTVQSCVKFWQ
ncbi:MAG: histone deacetylase [Bacteroidetes bacterium]|nr:histone deacetylase [Bacteroidota bacterium]